MYPSYALIIGVNNYTAYDASLDQPEGTSTLQGSLNDARLWLKLCRDLGYAPENIRVLTTPALPEAALEGAQHGPATAKTIRAGVQWLAEALGGHREASGLLTFSGHGDRTGEGLVLCPTDTTADGDELLNTVALMHVRETIDKHDAAENLTVALDCCHSGMDAGARKKVLALRKRAPEQAQQKLEVPLLGNRMYYAAEVGQSAYQATFCGRVHGAFTWAFMTTRDQWSIEAYRGHKQLDIAYGEMRQRSCALLESLSFGQAPELRIASSMKDLPLFCLGRQAEDGETSRKPTGERTHIQCEPGDKDYRSYTITQSETSIGQIVVPRSTYTDRSGFTYVPGNEYWSMETNVDTSEGNSDLQFSWVDYYWSDQGAPTLPSVSFTMVQAPAWSSTSPPEKSTALFVDNGADVPFCLNWAMTYDTGSETWSGNLTWYDATGESNVFGDGSQSPATAAPDQAPSSEAWYNTTCSPTEPLGADEIVSNTALTSYDDPQSVFYLNYGGDVLQSSGSSSRWTFDDLTTSINGAPAAAYGSALTSYTGDSTQAVVYLDTSGHVQQLYYYGSGPWGYIDVTSASGVSKMAATGSALTSYIGDSTQAVFYLDANGHVQQLYYYGSGPWGYIDVTSASGVSKMAATGSALTSYNGDGTQAVFYLDANGHVQQLYYYGSGPWGYIDVASAAGVSKMAATGSALTSYTGDNTQAVFYLDANGHVQQLYYYGSGPWGYIDVTHASGVPKMAAPGSALTSYIDDSTQAVFYLDANGHVQQLYYSGSSWKYADITHASGAPVAMSGSVLASYSNPQSVFYVDTSGTIQQIYLDSGDWKNDPVTS